jgi:Predicted membrane protein
MAAKNNHPSRTGSLKSILVDVLYWSRDIPIDKAQILASGLGMAVPVAFGAIFGNLSLGILVSFGVMFAMGVAPDKTIHEQTVELAYILLVGTAAVFIGSVIGGLGWLTGVLIIIISFVMAIFGGMSRFAVQVTTRFMIIIIIGIGLTESGLHMDPYLLTFIFAIGFLFGMGVVLAATYLFKSPEVNVDSSPQAVISRARRIKHWRRSLAHFAGWHYTIRITLSMIAAEIIVILFNLQLSYWVFLTIVLVLHRRLGTAFQRILQRGIGTIAGVLLGSLLLLYTLPPGVTVVIIGILASLRPYSKDRNYAVYALIMTPLVLIIVNQGQIMNSLLLFNRLIDTLIGCIIAITLGYFAWTNRNELSKAKKKLS